jgi:hypothetical protein
LESAPQDEPESVDTHIDLVQEEEKFPAYIVPETLGPLYKTKFSFSPKERQKILKTYLGNLS